MDLKDYLRGIETIYLKVTNECNLGCSFCYNQGNHSKNIKEIPDGILDDFKGLLIFHGGEPMLNYGYIEKVYNRYKYSNFKFSITTNLLTNVDKLIEYCNTWNNLEFVKVSYDVSGRFKYSEMEERFLANLKNLYKKTKKDIIVSICLTKDLISYDTKTIYNRFKYISDGLNFEVLTNDSEVDIEELVPLYSEIDEWLLDLYRIYYLDNKSLYISNFDDIENAVNGIYIGCRAKKCSKTVRTIETDGRIFGCPNTIFKPEGCLGIIEGNNAILYEENISKNIKNEGRSYDEFATCITCEYAKICNFGGCYQQKHFKGECPGLKKLMKEINQNKGDIL